MAAALPASPLSHSHSTIQIIDENDEWIVVEKPPFIEVHPSKPNGKRTLWHELRELLAFEIANGGQVSIVNRLDRETSGLTLVAKHPAAARLLCGEMMARRVEKEYLALVFGWPAEDEFTVDAPILRQGTRQFSPIHLKQMVHPEGALARTHVRVEQRGQLPDGRPIALVRAFPETGRMHQIRVHLAHAGHALIGDKIYGADENCYLEFIDTGWTSSLETRLLFPRHALHSTTFRLPALGLGWTSPLAPDLATWTTQNFFVAASQQPV